MQDDVCSLVDKLHISSPTDFGGKWGCVKSSIAQYQRAT